MKFKLLMILTLLSCKTPVQQNLSSASTHDQCIGLEAVNFSNSILSEDMVSKICKSLMNDQFDILASEVIGKAATEGRHIQADDFRAIYSVNYQPNSNEGLALADNKMFWQVLKNLGNNLNEIISKANSEGILISNKKNDIKNLVQKKVFTGFGVSGSVSILGYKGAIQTMIELVPFTERLKKLPNYMDGNLLGVEAVVHPSQDDKHSLGIFIYPGIIKSAGLSAAVSGGAFATSGCMSNQDYTGHFLTAGITFPAKIFAGGSMAYSAGASLETIKFNIDHKFGGINWLKAVNQLAGIESHSNASDFKEILIEWMKFSAAKSLLATIATAVGEDDVFQLSTSDHNYDFKSSNFDFSFTKNNILEPITFMPSARKSLSWFYELVQNNEGADKSTEKTDLKNLILAIMDGGLSECDSLGVSVGPAVGVSASILGQLTNYTLLSEIHWESFINFLNGRATQKEVQEYIKFNLDLISNLATHMTSGDFWALKTPKEIEEQTAREEITLRKLTCVEIESAFTPGKLLDLETTVMGSQVDFNFYKNRIISNSSRPDFNLTFDLDANGNITKTSSNQNSTINSDEVKVNSLSTFVRNVIKRYGSKAVECCNTNKACELTLPP